MTDGLAGETAADEVDWCQTAVASDSPPRLSFQCCPHSGYIDAIADLGVGHRCSVAVSDVSKPGNIGPVSCEDSPAPLIDFHLPYYLPASPFESEVKAADAGEQRADSHFPHPGHAPGPCNW